VALVEESVVEMVVVGELAIGAQQDNLPQKREGNRKRGETMKRLLLALAILFIACNTPSETDNTEVTELDGKIDSTITAVSKTNTRLDSLGIAINNNISDLELAIDEFNEYVMSALDDLLSQDTIYNTVYIPVPTDSPYTVPVPIDSTYYIYKYNITFKVESLDSIEYGSRNISVTWDHNIEPDLSHYTVYLRMGLGVWASNIDVDTTWVEITLPDTGLYYIYSTASDSSGNESPPSDVVKYRCVK